MNAADRMRAIHALRVRIGLFSLIRFARSVTPDEIAMVEVDCRESHAKLAAMGYFLEAAPVCLGD